jgi:hypothetical protein
MRMPRISAPIDNLVDSNVKLRELSLAQLVSFMRCGEYFRNEVLGRVSPWDFSKDPYSLLLHHLMIYILNYYAKNNTYPSDNDIVVRFSIAQNLLRTAGHSFIFHNKNNDILFSAFKWRSYLQDCKISSTHQLETFTSNGVSVNFTIPLISDKGIYLFSFLPKKEFIKTAYFHLPLLKHWNKKIFIVFLTGSNYNIENFTDKLIDLRKLNSVYASTLFAYKKNVYLPIFNCKNNTCPIYNKCNSMYSDDKDNE